MPPIRRNFIRGTVGNDPLASGGTTLQSSDLSDLPAISAPDFARLTIDPDGDSPEIVHVTSYDGTAGSATILRGQEGTSGQEWPQETVWRHTPTAEDFDGLAAEQVVTTVGDLTSPVTDVNEARPDVSWGLVWFIDADEVGGVPTNMEDHDLAVAVDEAEGS